MQTQKTKADRERSKDKRTLQAENVLHFLRSQTKRLIRRFKKRESTLHAPVKETNKTGTKAKVEGTTQPPASTGRDPADFSA
ncbi:hypothetical protein [Pelagicoccus sp. SDUM812003]|uniref:hypothetical protein n=1 Tax=Pelagicoccus sp. SDUM812003 TaxID=3041267 RepID=UPI00280E6296|nr:hypothetical protein [Pelagicoccus sp. SDUM812003]MDQ8204314.1 hypothetical protein [Pelagicoccus sp. SDUM812003]